MRDFTVWVGVKVKVTVDETKFDDAFMGEFRESFYPFHDLDDHVRHLAQLEARGLNTDDFIEGYGPIKEMGIKLTDLTFEIQDVNEITAGRR